MRTEIARNTLVTVVIDVTLAEEERFLIAPGGAILEQRDARRSDIEVHAVNAHASHFIGHTWTVNYRVSGEGWTGRTTSRQVRVEHLPARVRDHLRAALLDEGVEES